MKSFKKDGLKSLIPLKEDFLFEGIKVQVKPIITWTFYSIEVVFDDGHDIWTGYWCNEPESSFNGGSGTINKYHVHILLDLLTLIGLAYDDFRHFTDKLSESVRKDW